MENISKPVDTGSDPRRLVKLILSVGSVLCCLVSGSFLASFYFLNSVVEDHWTAATQEVAAARAQATATAIRHATTVAGYEIFDDFETNPHDWHVDIEENDRWNGSIVIRDGLYIWDVEEVKEADFFSWRGYEDQKIIQDFDLSVDVKLVRGSSDLFCYAVGFRSSPRNFREGTYLFTMCDNGVFEVKYFNSVNKSEWIRSWAPTSAIHTGDWNTLSVNARGEQVVLSINNIVVCEFTDAHLRRGKVFLVLRVFDDQPGTIQFDNFALQSYP